MSFITSPGVIVPPLTAGGVAYGTGSQAKVNSAGTAGQVLTSAGAGVPIWAAAVGPATPSAEGILYGKTNNVTAFQTFLGYQAGNVTTGVRNTFLGYQAGLLTTSGTSNTVVGESALKNNVTGAQNVAIGVSALEVSTASNNVAVGRRAMLSSTSGASNTGVGTSALETHTTSDFNVALGSGAGNRVTTGAFNVLVGSGAGFPLTTGSNNICIGDSATASSASVSNEIVVGTSITGKGANTAFIGGTSGAYNGGNTTTWTTTSDQRIKKNIVSVENALSVITALRPVEFDYKENDKHEIGFIAQEYQTVLPKQIIKHAANEAQKEMIGGDEVFGIQQNLVPYLVKALQELNVKFETYVATHP